MTTITNPVVVLFFQHPKIIGPYQDITSSYFRWPWNNISECFWCDWFKESLIWLLKWSSLKGTSNLIQNVSMEIYIGTFWYVNEKCSYVSMVWGPLDIRTYIHKFSDLTVTTCTGCLHSPSYEIISIVGFSFHSFIDFDKIMAKRTNSSGGPFAKSSQMSLLHFFI